MYSSYSNPYYYSSTPSSANASDVLSTVAAAALGIGIFVWIIIIALSVLILVARWKVFKKAGVNGWESLIPVHSDVVELQLGGVSTAIWFLNLIAICGIGPLIVSFWKSIALAKAFGKGAGFGVLLALLPFIGYPILGFGNAQFVGVNNNTTENV